MKTETKINTEQQDAVFEEAMSHFRQSIHAWSDAEFSKPRTVAALPSRVSLYRLAAGWAMTLVLAVGLAGGGVYKYHAHQQMLEAVAAQKIEQDRQVAQQKEQKVREAEAVLADVQLAVSREVPSALDSLAQSYGVDEQ